VRRFAASFLIEMAVWYGLAASFLALYVQQYAGPEASIAPHLRVLTGALAAFVFVRLVLWRWLPGDRAPRWLASLAGASLLLVLAAYYALVLVGLQSWGRVISWNLISTYAGQAADFLRSQEIAPVWATAAAGAAFGATTLVIARGPAKHDWVSSIARGMPLTVFVAMFVGAPAIAAVATYSYAASPQEMVQAGEPFSVTFFPEHQPARRMQRHRIVAAAALNAVEQRAKARYRANPGARRANVILVVADALRADHLQSYGYARDTTPYLASLDSEKRLTKVERVWSVCAQSSCGLLGLGRSRYVHELTNSAFTLQDVLKRHGYNTRMVMGGDHTNFYGLRKTYGDVDSYFDGASATGYYMNDDALVLDHVSKMEDWNRTPTMIQFHLMSTHYLGKRREESLKFKPYATYAIPAAQKLSVPGPNAEMTNFYDNGVVQFDETLRQLLQTLRQKGYLEHALVVITADHGEMLGEHHQFGHSKGVFDPALRLPWIMLRYGYEPEAVIDPRRPASQIDIAPTILAELGMPVPSSWSGRPLQSPKPPDYVFFQQLPLVGLVDARDPAHLWKFWRNAETGEEYAFDLSRDPGEVRNVVTQIPTEKRAAWRLQLLGSALDPSAHW
jgi:glucan phosphoethanolaminetransferase (alkaline phosphatase superfamily)